MTLKNKQTPHQQQQQQESPPENSNHKTNFAGKTKESEMLILLFNFIFNVFKEHSKLERRRRRTTK